VAAGQQRHEHPLEHGLLAHDDPLDLEERRLQRLVRRPGRVSVLPGVERVEPSLADLIAGIIGASARENANA